MYETSWYVSTHLKFRYSEKATKIWPICIPLFFWHYLVTSNNKWKMGQNFVAFSEYLNFNRTTFALSINMKKKQQIYFYLLFNDVMKKWYWPPNIFSGLLKIYISKINNIFITQAGQMLSEMGIFSSILENMILKWCNANPGKWSFF